MKMYILLLSLVPVSVIAGFLLHWLTLRPCKTAEQRLPYCRGAYIALSLQILLYSWILFFSLNERRITLSEFPVFLPLGMSFSFIGDIFNLQFPAIKKRVGQPVFYGILSFAVAQIFYILAFLRIIKFNELTSSFIYYPLLIVLVVVPAVIFRFRVYNKKRPKNIMAGAFFYGFILGAMAATALSAAFIKGDYWWAVAAGALFFLLSDAVMGETTIHGKHPKLEYQIPWGTYLAAQALIHFGAAALIIRMVF